MIQKSRKINKKCVAFGKNFSKINVYYIVMKFRNINKNINILAFFNWCIEYSLYLKIDDSFVPCLTLEQNPGKGV